MNETEWGGRSLPESSAGVARYRGGASKIAGSLVALLASFVGGNGREGEGFM